LSRPRHPAAEDLRRLQRCRAPQMRHQHVAFVGRQRLDRPRRRICSRATISSASGPRSCSSSGGSQPSSGSASAWRGAAPSGTGR
jgi:hypothetical protein